MLTKNHGRDAVVVVVVVTVNQAKGLVKQCCLLRARYATFVGNTNSNKADFKIAKVKREMRSTKLAVSTAWPEVLKEWG